MHGFIVSRALESQHGDAEHIETFSRLSAACKLCLCSRALSHCFVVVAPVVHIGTTAMERTHDTPSPTRGGVLPLLDLSVTLFATVPLQVMAFESL